MEHFDPAIGFYWWPAKVSTTRGKKRKYLTRGNQVRGLDPSLHTFWNPFSASVKLMGWSRNWVMTELPF